MRKKIAAVLLACALAVGTAVSPVGIETAWAETLEDSNGIYYQIEESGAIITGYDGRKTELVIPESIDGVKVTGIGYRAFSDCSSLTGISIPGSVTSIEEEAFSDCSSLTGISIPGSVTSIGHNAFARCSSVTSISIPSSVTSMANAFSGCSELTSITVEAGNPKYDSRENCNAIIEKESNTLVQGCKNTIIPESVTSIGYSAFSGCNSLTEIDIPESVTRIGYAAFFGCSSLTSISIPSSVTSIEYDAFSDCSSLTSISIPSSVTSIASGVFSGCSELTDITVEAGNPKYDSRENCNAIIEKESNKLVHGCKNTIIPDSVTSIGHSAFSGCNSLTGISIPGSVTSIEDWAFADCSSLTGISIPGSVTVIGYGVFSGCSSLTEVSIPGSVTSIEEEAFSGCSSLTGISIPGSVTSIGDSAFSGCSSLTGINIPSSVTSIGDSAFSGCSELTDITVETGNPKYDSRENCNAIIEKESNKLVCGCKNTIIPDSVTSIGDWAFADCSSLTGINIPDSVTSIGVAAFSGCSSLTGINIPDSVTFIVGRVFSGCSSLTEISIPSSVTHISATAFQDTPWLEEQLKQGNGLAVVNQIVIAADEKISDHVEIPSGVTRIGESVFSGWENLREISIPEGVTFIDTWAFSGCSSLMSISIPSSLKSVMPAAFFGCSSLKNVYYAGSETQWYKIGIGVNNGCLTWAERYYGSSESSNPGTDKKSTQTITASGITKTYGEKDFSLGASALGGAALSYAVSDPKVAAVDGNGNVTIKGCGITDITITAAETSAYEKAQKTIKLTVKPKTMTVSSVTSKKKKTAKVKWKKDKTVSGYIIECATDKKFRKNKVTVTVSKFKTASTTVKKLKAGKKYYVRICAYAKSGNTKVQGDWSKAKTVKIKK